jgi:glyoxylase-like metal-dependent hydrolase (beta-lactamase superfamily II)
MPAIDSLEQAEEFLSWHTVTQIVRDVYQISEPIGAIEPRFGVATVNMYLIVGRQQAALIDTGMGIGNVRSEIEKITAVPCSVFNTHFHWDHTGANSYFADRAIQELEVELVAVDPDVSDLRPSMQSAAAQAVLPNDFDPATYQIIAKPATRRLRDNDLIDLGNHQLRVIHTPGHSPGHAAYFDETSHLLFTGDAAYQGPMYACFEGSDPAAFAQSLQHLANLPEVSIICPGHDELISDSRWLTELARSAKAAVDGELHGQLHDEFIQGREFQFEGYSIWLPH